GFRTFELRPGPSGWPARSSEVRSTAVGEVDAVEAFIGLGANLGDREAAIRRALDLLAASPGISGLRPSPLYETAPIGYVAQPPFLNAVAAVTTRLGALQL